MKTKRHILSIQPGGRYNIVYTLGLADGFSTWEFPPVIKDISKYGIWKVYPILPGISSRLNRIGGHSFYSDVFSRKL